jgi:uncharacterized protein YjdB
VDKNGNITGISAGSAVITCAAASGDKKDVVNVTVIDLPGSIFFLFSMTNLP